MRWEKTLPQPDVGAPVEAVVEAGTGGRLELDQ